MSRQWLLLTGSVVENLPSGAAAGLVQGEHRHQERGATLPLEATVVAAGVAGGLLTEANSFD